MTVQLAAFPAPDGFGTLDLHDAAEQAHAEQQAAAARRAERRARAARWTLEGVRDGLVSVHAFAAAPMLAELHDEQLGNVNVSREVAALVDAGLVRRPRATTRPRPAALTAAGRRSVGA